MTFKRYLSRRRITATPPGDFVDDARSDPTFPDAESWDEVRDYLMLRGAAPVAVAAARSAWRSYLRSQRRREAA